MQQKRFFLAIIISAVILFAWSYFFPPQKTQQGNNNVNSASTAQSTASPEQQPQPTAQATQSPQAQQQGAQQQSSGAATENVARREITVETPLYKVKLDSQGGVVTSWVLNKNKENERKLWAIGGSDKKPKPLELVSEAGLNPTAHGLQPNQGGAPFRLVTGDSGLDNVLATRNYEVSGAGTESGNSTVQIGPGQSQTIQFVMRDPATGVDVVKKLTFRGDVYNVDLGVNLSRGGQPAPQAKLMLGPSIGDQGIEHYTFYNVAPEGVVSLADNTVERVHASSTHDNKNSPDYHAAPGNINWMSVGDTYFAMVGVPSKQQAGAEFRTVKYSHEFNGKADDRYLITGYLPIATDGSVTSIYTGPKDHDSLRLASGQISNDVKRPIELEGLFDYGWFAWMKKALALPILTAINWFYKVTNSYGLAIIIFTILLYSLFFPLKWRSSKSMKKAQKLAPRMKEIQEKMKGMKQNDPKLKELQMEQLKLMKEGNPLGGCLPLLIQMPFLFALYSAITISIDFRQASFLWMPDLSAGDPYHILEILMAGSMVVLQMVTPQPSADPLQKKMMAFMMPAMMLWMLWGAPSGLVVYWLVGNIVGFSQQFIINAMTKSEDDQPPPEQPVTSKKAKKLNTPRTSAA